MINAVFTCLSPAGVRARLSTLIFHRVRHCADPLMPEEFDASRFAQVCSWLKGSFNVLPAEVAVERLREGSLPDRAAVITFDDGYEDNLMVAAPILERYDLPATFFIVTSQLESRIMWNDVVAQAFRHAPAGEYRLGHIDGVAFGAVAWQGDTDRRQSFDRVIALLKGLEPTRRDRLAREVGSRLGLQAVVPEMMSASQVQQLSHMKGMTIGSHTVHHPILSNLAERDIEREIGDSRDTLRALTGQPIKLFAYPNGRPALDYTRTAVNVVRRLGFRAAFSTAWGASGRQCDLFQLPRFTPWDVKRFWFLMRMAANLRRVPKTLEIS
jgi:peptidoglycan/xylan/chitin deacetylase (PgdA/CDA1 family)